MIKVRNTQGPNLSSSGNPGNPPGLGSPAGIRPRPRVRRAVKVRR